MIPVGNNDRLVVYVYNDEGSVQIRVNYRLLLKDGTIQNGSDQFTPTTNRAESTRVAKLSEGFLAAVTVQQVSGTVGEGRCYVRVGVTYSGVSVNDHYVSLIEGSLSSLQPLGYPPHHTQNAKEGPGQWISASPSNPSAGAALTHQPNSGLFRIYQSIQFELATDANAANRMAYVTPRNSSNVELCRAPAGTQQTASTTFLYTFYVHATILTAPVGSHLIAPMPLIYLPDDYDWTIGVINIQAGDQIQNARMTYREWLVPWAV